MAGIRSSSFRLGRSAAVVAGLFAVATGLVLVLDLAPTGTGARSTTHTSPGQHFTITLGSDHAFGQVETLQVSLGLGAPGPRVIFQQIGDLPLRFLRWQDEGTALLEAPSPGSPASLLLLRCRDSGCTLQPAPAGAVHF